MTTRPARLARSVAADLLDGLRDGLRTLADWLGRYWWLLALWAGCALVL